MSKKAELLDKRATLLENMRSVLDTVEAEKRELTQEDKQKYDGFEKEFDKVDEQYRLYKKQEERELEEAEKRHAAPAVKGSAGSWIDVRSGKPLDVLTRNQNLSSLIKSEKDEPEISLGKTVRGLITGDWQGAMEEKRALSTSVGTAGGYTVPDKLAASVIDLARAKSTVLRAGANTIPMETQKMTIAKLASDPTFEYKAENAKFLGSDVTFDKLELNAYTLGTVVTLSQELLQDSPNAGKAIEAALADAIAAEIDRVALFGTGVNQPLGLKNTTGINNLAAIGALTDYSDFINAWVKILEANGEPNAYIISPREAGTLQMLKGSDGQYMGAPEAIKNLQRLITSKIPVNLGAGVNESNAFVGAFSELVFGVRRGMMIETSWEADEAFERYQYKIRCIWRGDVGVLRPNFFTLMEGITA